MARKKPAAETDADIVDECHKRYKECEAYESIARQNALDDLRFEAGDAYNNNQWPDDLHSSRGARPTLTINKTRQHCLQVINDCQQNAMGIKVNSTGFGSTSDAADAIEGIIRHVEYASNASQNAYRTAIQGQVKIGRGWIHITSDYMPGRSFDQEIKIGSVPDPLSVYSDPGCREPDHSDMRWAMIGVTMTRDEFDQTYPGHKDLDGVKSFGDGRDDSASRGWVTENSVRVMRYYRRSEDQETIWAIPSNLAGGAPGAGTKIVPESTLSPEVLELAHAASWPTRKVMKPIVQWYVIAGKEIIDSGDTVFDHIPLVPMIGEESVIDGVYDCKGHVRALIDAQRMYNYSASRYVEFVALQARAPFIGSARAIEGHENDWKDASSSNPPAVLLFNDVSTDDNTPLTPPSRIDPPSVDSASLQGMTQADQQMQMVSGQYEATMGQPSNEKSGVAIQQRQRQSDRATYHFTDNQGAALRLAGKIIIGAIPKVYDKTRAVQILGADGDRQGIIVDPQLKGADGNPIAHQTVQPPQVPATPAPGGAPPGGGATAGAPPPTQPAPDPNDPASPLKAILAINPLVGSYDVEADVGPAYATRRQEAFNAISQILQADTSLTPLLGDLLFKSADFPMADEMSERLKRMVPPQALGDDDPQVKGLQTQLQAMSSHLQATLQELAKEKEDRAIEKQKADAATATAKTRQYDSETDRLAALGSIDPAALIPVIRATIAQTMADMGRGQPVQLAHPHDASMGGPPDGFMAGPGGQHDLRPLPTMNPPGGLIRDPNET